MGVVSDSSTVPSHRPRRRRGWRAFFTPGWVLTAVIVVAFAYVAFTVLAPWQLGKNKDTQEFNHRLEAALDEDPVPLRDVEPADRSSAGPEKEWTRVELQGRFLPEDEVLLRNRPVDSSPAFQVLTPFRTDDGQTALVNRGWIPPKQGADVPEFPAAPAGEITVNGYIRMSEAPPTSAPITEQGHRQVYGMNTGKIGQLTGLQLTGDYVQLDEVSVKDAATGAGRGLQPIPLPDLESGPYLSYGIQWIAFGIMVPLGLGYFIWAEIRERRRQRAEIAASESVSGSVPGDEAGTVSGTGDETASGAVGAGAVADAGTAAAGPERVAAAAPDTSSGTAAGDDRAAAPSTERKLADRYGHSRNRFHERHNARGEERF
ncbi:SURF1 family protein [Corynebacterium nuruki]|uniref:SURF1 family cytochrome oxidase biogenesis protein n=1 Tax=Corynebacterium nuruki TaxID=1032851 RepID=UPI0039BFB6F6